MPTAPLTEDDLSGFQVEFRDGDVLSVRAAYVTTDEKTPGFLLLKDHDHQTVTMVSADLVRLVGRMKDSDA